MEELFSFTNVKKKYGAVSALNNLSFSITKGESVALIGNNGCGKTSTINVLCNLISYDEGEVKVFGSKVASSYVSYKRRFGIILSPPVFVDRFTPLEYLKFVCRFQKVDKVDAKQRIDDLLNGMEIHDADKKEIREYSSGCKMKIAFAAAIIHNPDVFVFDEPFLHLDNKTLDVVISIIKRLKSSKTLFVTSHNIDLVAGICDHFLIMGNGQVIEDITKDSSISIDQLKINLKGKMAIKDEDPAAFNWLK